MASALAVAIMGCGCENDGSTAQKSAEPDAEVAPPSDRDRTLLEQYERGEMSRSELVRRIRDGLVFSWKVSRDSDATYQERFRAYEPPELYVRCYLSAASDPTVLALPLEIEVRILELELGHIHMRRSVADDETLSSWTHSVATMVWDDYDWPGDRDVSVRVLDGDGVSARRFADPNMPLPSIEVLLRQLRDARDGQRKTMRIRSRTTVYHAGEKLAEGIDERTLPIDFFKAVPSVFWYELGAPDLMYPSHNKVPPSLIEPIIQGQPSFEILEFKLGRKPTPE